MTKSFRGVWLLVGAALLPQIAGAANQSVNLTADVPKYCQLNFPGSFQTSDNSTPGASSLGLSIISIDTPVNAAGIMQNWGFTFKVNSTCNAVSNLEITTMNGGLTTTGAALPGFLDRFDYTAQASFDGTGPATIPSTNGTPGASSIGAPHLTDGPFTGDVLLQVTGLPDAGAPVMSGFYTDTLTITLIPQ